MTIIEQAVDVLQKAKKVVFFTGAGISAENGIPTYSENFLESGQGTIRGI